MNLSCTVPFPICDDICRKTQFCTTRSGHKCRNSITPKPLRRLEWWIYQVVEIQCCFDTIPQTDGRTDRQNFHIAEAYRPARGYALKTWMKTLDRNVTIFEQPANQVLTLQLHNFTTWRIALMWVLCARNDAYRRRDTCHLHLHEISMFSVSCDCADASATLRYVLDNGRNWSTGRRYRLHSRLSSKRNDYVWSRRPSQPISGSIARLSSGHQFASSDRAARPRRRPQRTWIRTVELDLWPHNLGPSGSTTRWCHIALSIASDNDVLEWKALVNKNKKAFIINRNTQCKKIKNANYKKLYKQRYALNLHIAEETYV